MRSFIEVSKSICKNQTVVWKMKISHFLVLRDVSKTWKHFIVLKHFWDWYIRLLHATSSNCLPNTSVIDIPVIYIYITGISITEVFGRQFDDVACKSLMYQSQKCFNTMKCFQVLLTSLKTRKWEIFIFQTTVWFLQIDLETSINERILNVHATDPLLCFKLFLTIK